MDETRRCEGWPSDSVTSALAAKLNGLPMLLQKRIYEWSKDLPQWQCDLLRRLTAGPLTPDDERDVLRMLAGSPDAPTPEPLQLRHLPADDEEHRPVELRAVRDFHNINCLARGQKLRFESGLNVVFGLNGAGKSGYGRVLRRVCRSGDPDQILRDVFDPGAAAGPQTAALDIEVAGEQLDLQVDLAREPERVLSAMTVFDASRARVSLAKPSVIEHVPRPLRLLRALVATQDRLTADLRERREQRSAQLSALPALDSDTDAAHALGNLDSGSDAAAIVEQAKLTAKECARLDELQTATALMKADQGRELEATMRARAKGARDAVAALTVPAQKLTPALLAETVELRRRLDEVAAAEQKLATEAFADQRFDGTGEGVWRELWFAAQRFAQAAGRDFPSDGPDAACPLCQQDLDEQALRRLAGFQEFVAGDLRRQATSLERELSARLHAVPDLATVRATVEGAVRGTGEQTVAAAENALVRLEAAAQRIRDAAEGKHTANATIARPDLAVLESYAAEQLAAAEHQAGLLNEDAQGRLVAELRELRARAALVAAEAEVTQHVEGLKAIGRIDESIGKLGTTKISRRLRELQEATITERLRTAIETELNGLDPVAGRVEVIGKASKGETVIELRLKDPCRERVGNVLSDGEQRALALAFFLGEVAVSGGRSAIILDDPVSSLDDERRTYLAGRLARESRRRQVIVFTHDMTFVHLLQEVADAEGAAFHGQTLERALNRVGMVSDELPTKMLGTTRRLKALHHRLRFELTPLYKHQDPSYEREHDRWVVDLRKAWDQLIEDGVLGGVVRRFSPFIRIANLHKVNCTPDIVARVKKGQRTTSPKTHHEPLELNPGAHTPDQMEVMLAEFAELVAELKLDEQAAPVTPPEAAEQVPVVKAVEQGSFAP